MSRKKRCFRILRNLKQKECYNRMIKKHLNTKTTINTNALSLMSHSFNLNLLSESVDQVLKTNVNDLFMNQTPFQ